MKAEYITPIFPNSVNIVFGADNNFFLPLVVCIQSIICHVSEHQNYDIVILSQKFNIYFLDILNKMAVDKKNISIRVCDITYFVEKWNINILETGHRLSIAAYYRLFIPEIMKEYHKVLYLDGDTILLEDPKVIFSFDIRGGVYAGAVKDFNIIEDMSLSFKKYVQNILRIKDVTHYFNSGVMLLNLDYIRKDFSLSYLIEQAASKGKKHHDQDVLNSLFYNKIYFLPPRYNVMWLNNDLYNSVPGGKEAINHPAIIHFTGSGKPWLKGGAEHHAARHFWKYAELCPYYDEINKVYRDSCKKDIQQYKKKRLKYIWYKLLAILLWGRKRRHYIKKSSSLKSSLELTKKMMKSIQ